MDFRGLRFLLLVITSFLVGPSLSSESDDAACLAASKAYVAALLSFDSSQVPLHPLCIRIENGIITGVTGPEIAFDLNTSLAHRVIKRVYNEAYAVDNGLVIANYLLDTRLGPIARTARVDENFTFQFLSWGILPSDSSSFRTGNSHRQKQIC
ncbi:hypothetical protein R1sor_015348 [Riccia sorocarpa]|uniref:DUF8021 domain-containing protein n=1 Tax=Riccia sorocarpa TaxID=122646 RepID=A0ABD3HEZ9_9MARC